MKSPGKILVFQTAFLGDVILTLPMIQVLKKNFPLAEIDVVTTPVASSLLENHPAVSHIIQYDKRKSQKGIKGIISLALDLRHRSYDVVVVPHRSFRTASVVALTGIQERIGFSNASARFVYNHIGEYIKTKHEIERNYALLSPFNIRVTQKELPSLYPSLDDINRVNKFLFEREILNQRNMVAIAPGSVWNTKRWLLDRFTQLALRLATDGKEILIIGGAGDTELGRAIIEATKHKQIHDTTGKLSLLQSAELIGRCNVLISNDSAPLHIGVAMRTPVVAIFGATVPEFGFAPYGKDDVVVETKGLSCRPCAIHGGDQCPIGTFECMKKIESGMVYDRVQSVLRREKSDVKK
ncbi:MAG: lipopolysaccharide heptosyltransferase II [Ignavibacteriales bacterium]|nr:lipopolysaccharide heptosyltransferase II [Ignavibacteriales bacterium]